MSAVLPPEPFDAAVDTLIVGARAAGLVAALAAAAAAGREVLVLERDAAPSGSTALSAGLIPAAGMRWRRLAGIEDCPARFAEDIPRKARGENEPALVAAMTEAAGPALEWLADRRGFDFSLVHDFDSPGHTRRRMHGLPSRSGRELADRLRAACEAAGVTILCSAVADALYADARVRGVRVARPDGSRERIARRRLVLACNGFGANRQMVARHMSPIADALDCGQPGDRGEAMAWGAALGAAIRRPGAYQGHGNVARPHGILITWATITEGGFQAKRLGRWFWDESQGYSEAARAVLAQPEGEAVTVFDARIAAVARQFADFRAAEAAGAIRRAETPEALAAGGAACGVSASGDAGHLSGNGLLAAVTLGRAGASDENTQP